MALIDGTGPTPRETPDDINRRFGIAQDGRPTDAQLNLQATIRSSISYIAHLANDNIADGRNKSLGFTALEDALMRFGKAIFEEEA